MKCPACGQDAPEADARWILWYEDRDRSPEHFSHDGADVAANHRFEQASIAWTCTLFKAVRKSGFGPECPCKPAAEGAQAVPVAWMSPDALELLDRREG